MHFRKRFAALLRICGRLRKIAEQHFCGNPQVCTPLVITHISNIPVFVSSNNVLLPKYDQKIKG